MTVEKDGRSAAADVHVAVIGGGPAGLMAAETLAEAGVAVTVVERMPSLGRKFLLAGRGGLNLTHSEDAARFLARYGHAEPHLSAAIRAFPPIAVRDWCEGLGEPTFVGTSGRVFPKTFKASPLLRAWLRRLAGRGVRFLTSTRWQGFDASGHPRIADPGGRETVVVSDATVLALGGASWPRMGSDGAWVAPLGAMGVAIAPLRPSNCGFAVEWSAIIRERFAGQPLKRVALTFRGTVAAGEAILTRTGLEGGAVYALSAPLREAIAAEGTARLTIDLRPDMGILELVRRLNEPRGKQSTTNFLRKAAGVSPIAIALMREVDGGRLPAQADTLARLIKAVPVRLTGVQPIARAISTAGGVRFDELDVRFMLKDRPGIFLAGEMLDWEAPTGGYLLQAAFATGVAAGKGVLAYLAQGRKA